MKSIQKLRIENSMAGLFKNVMAFHEAITDKSISTDRKGGKTTLNLDKPTAAMKQKFPKRFFNSEDPPSHQWKNELNYEGKSEDLKHNFTSVLSTSTKDKVFTKAIDRSSGMLTNTVCRN